MAKMIRNAALVAVAGAGLAACGGGDDTPPPPTPPPVVVTPKLEDQFGINFGIAYRNSPNTDATDPGSADLIPLSLTTDPVTI